MDKVIIDKKDEIVMRLVHYFVTEKNYSPIIVNGAKNEVWLENNEGEYRIIRINSNHIHNNEQLSFDIFKTKNVMKQIKNKTFSFKINILNIFLDVRDEVEIGSSKNVESIKIKSLKELKNNKVLLNVFPDMQNKMLATGDNVDFIMNVAQDINKKTSKDNKYYEETFKKKPIIITKILIAINILMFILANGILSNNDYAFYRLLWLDPKAVSSNFEIWRIITCTFLHVNFLHLFVNMYSLNIIGSQIENFFGKTKFIIIYLFSGIIGSMLSILLTNNFSVGASGAIFGLLGSILYFGYNYRLYLGEVLKTQIIPLIAFNLALGFLYSGIDNAAHIGGLVGGVIVSMALGVKGKTSKSEQINAFISGILLMAFLLFMILK